MKILEVLARLVTLFLPCLVLGHPQDDGTDEVMRWLIANGATVNGAVHSHFFQYGDASVRGILAADALPGQTSVLSIPKKLWLEPSHYPNFMQSPLPSSCQFGPNVAELSKELKFAAALASEMQKGSSSFYYPYLKHLPNMEEFHSFLPWMMESALESEFASLPIVALAQQWQAYFTELHTCFDSWAKADGSPAKGLSWEHTLLGVAWIRTRSFLGALVPGADMVNTAKVGAYNVEWSVTETEYIMHTGAKPVAAASELYDSYCPTCDNSELLDAWGLYLEDNPNPVERDAKICSGEAGMRMKEATQAALQDAAAAVAAGWTSPRCRASIWHMAQGPLRCSLARLSWETCAEKWDIAPSPHGMWWHLNQTKTGLVSHSARVVQQRFLGTES